MATHNISNSDDWRAVQRRAREKAAESLTLPSGTVILAARPEPLEWILAGRLPQRLLAAALEGAGAAFAPQPQEISREEILELARFAMQLVKASVVRPAIGDAPGEIAWDDIPVEDRAFIFEWACRALRHSSGPADASAGANAAGSDSSPHKEDLSSPGLERFRQK